MGSAWLAMGLIPIILGAWLLAKHGFRVQPGSARALASTIIAWGWVTVGMEVLGNLGRIDPTSLVAWSLGGLVIAIVVSFVRPYPSGLATAEVSVPTALGVGAIFATGLVLCASLRFGLVSFFQPVKVVSDGPIYHLYMAARWWKAGRIFLVATPFGEVGATYFWANGELWYAWLMTLFGGDRFARVGQVPFLVFNGLAVEAIARHLKVGGSSARIAALVFVTLGPGFILGFEPNVDNILVGGYLGAAYFFLRSFDEPERIRIGFLILGSLSAGLGMGTKPTGIVFFPPMLVLVVGLILARSRRSPGRAVAGVVAAIVPALAMMGYWPIRNAILTGNPLYPLHVEAFGKVWLSGWFGPDAMAFSPFYVPRGEWRAFVDIMMEVIDPRLFPLWLAASIGFWAVGRPRSVDPTDDRPKVDRWVWGFTALAVFNLAAYWLVIPYRTQQRFALPGIALFTVSLAKLLDRSAWLRGVAIALLVLHLTTPEPWPIASSEAEIPWDLFPVVPNYLPAPLDIPLTIPAWNQAMSRRGLWATLALGVGAMGAVAIWYRPVKVSSAWKLWLRGLVVLFWLAPFTATAAWCLYAFVGVPFPLFQDYNAGWSELESRVGRQGGRIAYAGNKIPYYLMGSKLQNEVRYINIDAHRDWLLHDYHRNASAVGLPETWPNPFPGWDRYTRDYQAWLDNLRSERIDLLVVTRVNIEEGFQNAADADRFPIERVWADAHPEVFRPIFGQDDRGSRIRIYQVLPP